MKVIAYICQYNAKGALSTDAQLEQIQIGNKGPSGDTRNEGRNPNGVFANESWSAAGGGVLPESKEGSDGIRKTEVCEND